MCKKYNTKEDAKAAVRKAVSMRHEWENAIRNKATREQLELKGLKSVAINEY